MWELIKDFAGFMGKRKKYWLAPIIIVMLLLGVLIVLVDRHGLQHEYVQGVMILFLAVFFFLLQKFWIFRDQSST